MVNALYTPITKAKLLICKPQETSFLLVAYGINAPAHRPLRAKTLWHSCIAVRSRAR